MANVIYNGKCFAVDDFGCLCFFDDWQFEFAEGLAEDVGIVLPLTEAHKKIIQYLREYVIQHGRTPIVYRACRDNGIKLSELEKLFPAGYHRGACRLAGLNYFDSYNIRGDINKTYRVNVGGFLVDPTEWDTAYANTRAYEFGIELTEKHWQVIYFLREYFEKNKQVPNIFEVNKHCTADLEKLFPPGYHRGALKIAGLCIRS